LGVAADVGFAAVLIPLAGAPTAGAAPNQAEVALGDELNASTNQLFGDYSANITDIVRVTDSGINSVYGDYLGALPSVSNTAAFLGLVEVSGEDLTNERTSLVTDFRGLTDVFAARHDLVSSVPVAEPDLGDGLGSVTNLYEGFSTNIADILRVTDAGVNQAHGDYLDALSSGSNAAAFIGQVEVSLELLTAQGQANPADILGLFAALGAHLDLSNLSSVAAAELDLSAVQGALTDQFEVLSANLTENLTITQDAFAALGADPAKALEASFELLEALFQADFSDIVGFPGVLGTDLGLVLGAGF
jgi:hypothetical protein